MEERRHTRAQALRARATLLLTSMLLVATGGCEFVVGPRGSPSDGSSTAVAMPTQLPPVQNWPRTSIRVAPDLPEPVGRLSLAVPPGWHVPSFDVPEIMSPSADPDGWGGPVAHLFIDMTRSDAIAGPLALGTPIVVGGANGVSMPHPAPDDRWSGDWGSTVLVEGNPILVDELVDGFEFDHSEWLFELSYGDGSQTADEAGPYLEVLRQILDTVSFERVEDWPGWDIDQSWQSTTIDYPLDLITPSPHMRFMGRYWSISIPPGWELVQSNDGGWTTMPSAAHDPAEDGLTAGPLVMTVRRATEELAPEVLKLLDPADGHYWIAEAVLEGEPPPRLERHGYILDDIGVRLDDELSPSGRSLQWRTRDWQASVEVPYMEPTSDVYRRYERAALLLLMRTGSGSYRQELPEGYPGTTP